MQVTQTQNTETIRTVGSEFTAQIPMGPVHTKVVFSDGTTISKYGKTNFWVCIKIVNGWATEDAIATEDLLTYLPTSAAEELIYNMDQFVQL